MENLGILFPVDEKEVGSSPRRKLPSIRDHNIIDENVEEGKCFFIFIFFLFLGVRLNIRHFNI